MFQKQHITVAQVQENARKAYDDGRLLAQQPDITRYFYKEGDCGCAIGVSLTDDISYEIDRNGSNTEILRHVMDGRSDKFTVDNFLTWDNDIELSKMVEIQSRHDEWKNSTLGVYDRIAVSESENTFLLSIDHPNAKPVES